MRKKKKSLPELYKLASVVYAIPPTQSTVERAFSSLPIVLTSHRTRLGSDVLQNIFLIRLNNKHYIDPQDICEIVETNVEIE